MVILMLPLWENKCAYHENTEINGVRKFIDTNQNFEKIGYGTLECAVDKDGYVAFVQTTGKPINTILIKCSILRQTTLITFHN